MLTKSKIVVHVNRQIMAFNLKHNTELPIYTIKFGPNAPTRYSYSVKFTGPSVLIDPRKESQLRCGARAWMETESEIILDGNFSWQEVQEMKADIVKKMI